MKFYYIKILFFAFFTSNAVADTVIRCSSPNKSREAILLKQAPSGASRISEFMLEVNNLKGKKIFLDEKDSKRGRILNNKRGHILYFDILFAIVGLCHGHYA